MHHPCECNPTPADPAQPLCASVSQAAGQCIGQEHQETLPAVEDKVLEPRHPPGPPPHPTPEQMATLLPSPAPKGMGLNPNSHWHPKTAPQPPKSRHPKKRGVLRPGWRDNKHPVPREPGMDPSSAPLRIPTRTPSAPAPQEVTVGWLPDPGKHQHRNCWGQMEKYQWPSRMRVSV